jgi:hypothetical protein
MRVAHNFGAFGAAARYGYLLSFSVTAIAHDEDDRPQRASGVGCD